MRRIARVEQNPQSGMYSLTIYDEDKYGKEYITGLTAFTMSECHKKAWEYGVTRDNLSVCIGREVY